MNFSDLFQLVLNAPRENRPAVVFDALPSLEQEDREAAFLLYLALLGKPSFIDDCRKATDSEDLESLLSLTLDMEQRGIPLNAFLRFFYFSTKDITNAKEEGFYSSIFSTSFLEDYKEVYGQTFGLGSDTVRCCSKPHFFLGSTLFVNTVYGLLSPEEKNKATALVIGPKVNHLPDCFASDSPLLRMAFLSDKLSRLGDECFENCPSLESVFIGQSITDVGKRAFKNCPNLKRIKGAFGAKRFFEETFKSDTSLEDFSFLPSEFEADASAFEGTDYSLVPEHDAIELATNIKKPQKNQTAKESYGAYADLTRATWLSNPDSLKRFSDAEILELGSALLTINGLALSPLKKLKKIVFKGKNAFYFSNDWALYKKELNGKITLIRFFGDPSHAEIALAYASSIGPYSFSRLTFSPSLFRFPTNIKKISGQAFEDCVFGDVVFPNLRCETNAFVRCSFRSARADTFVTFSKGSFLCENGEILNISVEKWEGASINEIFHWGRNQKKSTTLSIGQALLTSREKLADLASCFSNVEIGSIKSFCRLPCGIQYDLIKVDSSHAGEQCLCDLKCVDRLVIPKMDKPLSISTLFGNQRAKIKRISLSSPIQAFGMRNCEIECVEIANEGSLFGLEQWDALSIGDIRLKFKPSNETILNLKRIISGDIYVLDKKVDPLLFPEIKNGVLVRRGNTPERNITLDSSYCRVIAKGAYSGVVALESLTLGAGVEVEPGAFSDLVCLDKLVIDGDVNHSIKTIFGEEVLENLKTIGFSGAHISSGFCANLPSLASASLDNVKAIGKFAFLGCTSLTNISLSEGVTSIGDFAFADCSNLVSIDVPKSARYIGLGFLSGCSSLARASLPTFVGHYLKKEGFHPFGAIFGVCQKDEKDLYDDVIQTTGHGTRVYSIPKSLKEIVAVNIDGLVSYGFFSGLNTRIKILGDLRFVLPFAFKDATNVFGLFFDKLERIGEGAFENCVFHGNQNTPFRGTVTFGSPISLGRRSLAFGDGFVRRIAGAKLSGLGEHGLKEALGPACDGIIELEAKYLPDEPLGFLKNLKSVKGEFEDGAVPENYFKGLEALESISIDNPIHKIGANAFEGLSFLKTFAMKVETSAEVDDGAFKGLNIAKTGLILPKINSIGKHAFDATTLINLDFISKYASIGEGAFYQCVVSNPASSLSFGKDSILGKKSLAFKKLELASLEIDGLDSFSIEGLGLLGPGIAIGALKARVGKDFTLSGYNGKHAHLILSEGKLPPCLFKNAQNLEEIAIESPLVEKVGSDCFSGCAALKKVAVNLAVSCFIQKNSKFDAQFELVGEKPSFITSDAKRSDSFLLAAASQAETLELTSNVIQGPFTGMNQIKKLVLSSKNVEIGDRAFQNAGFECVEFKGDRVKIGVSSFSMNHALKEIKTKESTRLIIGNDAFEGDENLLVSGSFLSLCESVGPKAFLGCALPEEICVPASFAEFAKSFPQELRKSMIFTANEDQLEDLNGISVTSLSIEGPLFGKNDLSFGKSLVFVTVRGNAPVIPNGFFKGMPNLKEVIIQSGTDFIGEEAFAKCPSLKRVVLPATVDKIKGSPFLDTPSDLSIELESVTQKLALLRNNPNCFLRKKVLFIKRNITKFNYRKVK